MRGSATEIGSSTDLQPQDPRPCHSQWTTPYDLRPCLLLQIRNSIGIHWCYTLNIVTACGVCVKPYRYQICDNNWQLLSKSKSSVRCKSSTGRTGVKRQESDSEKHGNISCTSCWRADYEERIYLLYSSCKFSFLQYHYNTIYHTLPFEANSFYELCNCCSSILYYFKQLRAHTVPAY